MSRLPPAVEALHAWLASAPGLAALEAAAHQALRFLRRQGLHGTLARIGIQPQTPAGHAAEELRGELYLYLLENAHRLAPNLAKVKARAGAYLLQTFLNHCREMERRPDGDPFRARYRQVAEAMRREGGFFSEKIPGGGIRYSLSIPSRPIAPLADEDLEAVGPPPDEGAVGAPGHLHCAAYFWRALQARFGGQAIWVDLRDLIRWLDRYGDLAAAPTAVALTDALANTLAAPAAAAVDVPRVRQWAAMFAQGLAPRDRRLWRLRFGQGLGFKEIAAQMGYGGPSGAHARVERLQEMLCDFIQNHDLPWLGPEDADDEARAIFHHALLAAVEKSLPAPSIEGKAPPSQRGRRGKESP